MAVQIEVKSLEEVPEIMREFVTEQEGTFQFDPDKAFKALKEEREISKTAKAAYAPFKALGMTAEEITGKLKEWSDIGKTPSEIAELIAKSAEPVPKPDFTKTTEYLKMQKELAEAKKFRESYEAEKALNLKNRRNDFVRKIIRELPDKVDKEGLSSLVEDTKLFESFTLNETNDGLNPINDKLPGDYLLEFAEKHHQIKTSTPGIAAPGNTTITKANFGDGYAAAKAKGDIQGMLANAPTVPN